MGKVASNITGTISSVPVAVGQSVSAGDVLLVVESMKMEIPQAAERAGIVREVLVEAGMAVQEGDPLMVLE